MSGGRSRGGDAPMDDLFAMPVPARSSEPGESPESAIAVSTLTELIKSIVEGSVPPIWIRGEVTGFKAHRNGHWYFTLRDAGAQIRCVVWARDKWRLPAAPDEGMQIAAFGRMSVYSARAEVEVCVLRIEAEGDGLWRKAFDRSRAKLEADGLLDPARKRSLPRYPRVVAVVTSPDGAALHDIVSVARRRDPTLDIVVVPAAVQGESAAREIVAALKRVTRWGRADLVIVGRGGGSREDLQAFNDERVARAIAACTLPTISAVGHEVDVSLADLVADLRAATPSAAAEAAVPMRSEIEADVERTARRLRGALSRRAERARSDLSRSARELSGRARRVVEMRRAWLAAVGASLDGMSPLKTLERGYAVARGPRGNALTGITDFAPGGEFALIVRDGQVQATTVAVRAETR